MSFLNDYLVGQRTTRTVEAIQQNTATVGGVLHDLGHEALFVHLEDGFSDAIMQTGMVGYNIENPIFINKIPSPTVVTSTPTVRQSNAPVKGACK